ncbi:DMT family transporter [Streptomyces sp. NPDC048338]|uniref:DMT family transporter n=1 Tax=Streptomyces sp. NPDC048338 TaxID=3365536 RepID=UPI0037247546
MNALDGTVVAVLLSLVSAAGYALAAVAQSRLAASSDGGSGALRALLARGQWWWAVGLNAAGALAHVAALHYGPLTLVQPLGALTLVAALPLGAYCARRRVTRPEWRGALWTLVGLVGLVSVTGPAKPGEALSLREALVVAAATGLLIAALASGRLHGGVRADAPGAGSAAGGTGRARGLGHATASGVASGVASALTQTVTSALAHELPGGALRWWQTTLVAVLISAFAVGGLLLSQSAYRGGLAAPLAVVNLSNPAAAAVIGVALLGESFRAGAWGWLVAAAASAVAARGVILLTSGPAPAGPGIADPGVTAPGAAAPAMAVTSSATPAPGPVAAAAEPAPAFAAFTTPAASAPRPRTAGATAAPAASAPTRLTVAASAATPVRTTLPAPSPRSPAGPASATAPLGG